MLLLAIWHKPLMKDWCHDAIADDNIYDHDEYVDIVWLYDVTNLLMHENIIDMFMTWIKMTKVDFHLEGEYLHKIPSPIIIIYSFLTLLICNKIMV